jgi:HTH-type transcriptional regulator, transcriptional repressor of NAD biosynthesis genes
MSERFAIGLVVGKFAPLHAGHLSVVRRAQAACDRVVIFSYSNPELPECDPARREGWLNTCCRGAECYVITNERLAEWFPGRGVTLPDNAAPDDVQRDFCFELLQRLVGEPVGAVFTSEAYGPGFAARLTSRYRAINPAAAAVSHVAVDPSRHLVPASGTALRENLWQHWAFLPPAVARTLVQRVVFLGGESSGKSTLAAALGQQLQTACVAEYGRELWEAQGGNLGFDDLLRIAREQMRREDQAAQTARAFVFCDTSPLTTLFYCQEMFGRAEPELVAAAQRPYHHVYLCAPDFPFAQDGTRRDGSFRQQQHAWYQAELARRGIPFRLAEGSLAERIARVRAHLGVPAVDAGTL